MRVAVSATKPGIDAEIDQRFGRCAWFVIVEADDMSFEALENPNVAVGGAGIQSAQLLADRNVEMVLTGNCGPNAHQTLGAAGIGVVVGCSGTVSAAVERLKAGELEPADQANVQIHAGMGGGGGGGRGMGGGGGRGR